MIYPTQGGKFMNTQTKAVLAATWFGVGLIPPVIRKGMAGTYGSIAALPLCWLMVWLYWYTAFGPLLYAAAVIGLLAVGLWCVPIAEEALGPRTDWKGKTKTRDQNQIVIDEVWGMMYACYPIAVMHPSNPLTAFAAALLLFRVFDIAKPWPVRQFDRIKTPMGVMLDDMVAGAWAAIGVIAVILLL